MKLMKIPLPKKITLSLLLALMIICCSKENVFAVETAALSDSDAKLIMNLIRTETGGEYYTLVIANIDPEKGRDELIITKALQEQYYSMTTDYFSKEIAKIVVNAITPYSSESVQTLLSLTEKANNMKEMGDFLDQVLKKDKIQINVGYLSKVPELWYVLVYDGKTGVAQCDYYYPDEYTYNNDTTMTSGDVGTNVPWGTAQPFHMAVKLGVTKHWFFANAYYYNEKPKISIEMDYADVPSLSKMTIADQVQVGDTQVTASKPLGEYQQKSLWDNIKSFFSKLNPFAWFNNKSTNNATNDTPVEKKETSVVVNSNNSAKQPTSTEVEQSQPAENKKDKKTEQVNLLVVGQPKTILQMRHQRKKKFRLLIMLWMIRK